jgi:tetratricopeptide (TPR) repeat protein
MANEDIDIRSDVYSLGVLLYVLLAGILPYDSQTVRGGGVEHVRKVIRETDPKTPSTRLLKLGEEARELAENRRTELAALAKCLHRELEWIPLKAMRKDRAERYRSASELADDIENYLKGAPLIGRPLSTTYRFRKFVRRNRALVTGIGAVLVILVAGVVISTFFAVHARQALDKETLAREEAQLITNFLENDVLGSADEARVGEATVSFILNSASKSLETKLKDTPLIQASLYRKLGDTYQRLGEHKNAEQHLSKAIEIYGRHHGDEDVETLEASHVLAWVYESQGRYYDMERLGKKNLEIAKRVADVRQQIGCMNRLALAYHDLGKYKHAEFLFQEAISLRDSRKWEGHIPGWFIECNLACVYIAQGRYAEAEPVFVETLASVDGIVEHYAVKLANMYREQGRYKEAESQLDRALKSLRVKRGEEYSITLECMYGLVRLHIDQNRYNQAKELLNKAIPIARRRRREDHPLTLRFLNAHGVVLTNQKQYDQAEKLFDEALEGRQCELGEDHPEMLETINDFGVLRYEQKNYPEAERLLRQALDGRQDKLGSDHPHTLESMHELAVLYMAKEDYEMAAPKLLDAYDGREDKLGPKHPRTLESLRELVNLYESWKKPGEAERWRAKLKTHAGEIE